MGGPRLWRIPIPPFLAAYYLLCLAAVILAWLKGGDTERLGALAIIVVFGVSLFLPPVRIRDVAIGETAIDLGLMMFFGWLALDRERWWPLAMTAVMTLTVLVHLAMFLSPEIGVYAEVSARIGLGIAMALVLLASPAERWLAGESAVFEGGPWVRRPSIQPRARATIRRPEDVSPSRPSS